jgi:photosystem II stability/assembly factor-like uncharacterized protein
MRTNILCLAIALLAFPNICAARDLWTSVGPEGGAVSSMAIDPQNPSILYAGTASGRVFKSTNGGNNWKPAGDLDTSYVYGINVYAMAIDPKNPSTLYAGTGWLYKSTDGGASWIRSSNGITGSLIRALAIDPVNPSILYAGTYSGGIFKTTNGGVSWSAVNTGISSVNVVCLEINPQNPNIIYAGTGGTSGGLYKSVDGGGSWSAAGLNIEIAAVKIDPVNPDVMYATTLFSLEAYTPPALHKSTDGGSHWTEITPSWQTPGALAIDPQKTSVLYVAGFTPMDGAVKTADGGATWTGIGVNNVAIRSFHVNPQSTAFVYALTDRKGIYRSVDSGATWSASNTGLNAVAVETVVFDPRSPATLYAAGQSTIMKSTNGGGDWTYLSLTDSFMVGASYLVLDPQNPAVLYGGYGGLYKTVNGGISWNRLSLNTTVFALAVDPKAASTLYAGTSDSGVLKSTSGGVSWSSASNGLPAARITALAIDPQNTATVYAGVTSDGIFKSTDGGDNWTRLNTGYPGLYIEDLVINSKNTAIVYAVAQGAILRSTDGGASWAFGGLGGVTTVAIDPLRPTEVYAGTSRGVFKSVDGGVQWNPMNNGISDAMVRALAIDAVGRRIYAGTSNSGVWAASLDSALEFQIKPGGATTVLTSGTGELRSGYAEVFANSTGAPYGTAVFTYRQNGVVVSEAAVPATKPTTSTRVFVDYRDAVNAIPARSEAGVVDTRTGIAIVNYSSETASIIYTLRNAAGSTLAIGQGSIEGWHHVACFIEQLTSCGVQGFNLPADFRSAVQFGSLDIASDQPLSVLALRGIINQRDEFLITTTPVADLTQTSGAGSPYFPQFVDGAGYTTSLILMNTTAGTESGMLQIRDKDGNPLIVNQVGGTADALFRYSIPPNGIFRFQTDGFPAELKAGWVRLVPDISTAMPVGSGIFGYNPQDVLVSESGIPSATPVTHARVFVDLSGKHNTGLAIANVTNLESSITIKAFGQDGFSGAGSSRGPVLLPARGHTSGFADDFVTGLPPGFTGVLDISSSAPFAALTLRSLVNERNEFLMTTLPIADQSGIAPSLVVFPHLSDGGGYTTQFVLLSAGAVVDGSLIFYDESGESFYSR